MTDAVLALRTSVLCLPFSVLGYLTLAPDGQPTGCNPVQVGSTPTGVFHMVYNAHMNRWYRLALVCWLFPLVTGLSIFLLWVQTRSDQLLGLGMWTLLGGTALFLFGCVFVVLGHNEIASDGRPPSGRTWKSFALLLLLVSNFPVAFGVIAAYDHIVTRFFVTIINDSPTSLQQVVIAGPGVHVECGSIQPGATSKHCFHIRGSGTLACEFMFDGVQRKCVLHGYVISSFGGDLQLTIAPDGTAKVVDFLHERFLENNPQFN